MNALIPIANGSEELEVITLVNVLRRAGINVTLASTGPERNVRCARSTVIEADCLLGKLAINHPFDLIAVPGGMPGAANLVWLVCENPLKSSKSSVAMRSRTNGSPPSVPLRQWYWVPPV